MLDTNAFNNLFQACIYGWSHLFPVLLEVKIAKSLDLSFVVQDSMRCGMLSLDIDIDFYVYL